jgi:signal transduction histidine kinase
MPANLHSTAAAPALPTPLDARLKVRAGVAALGLIAVVLPLMAIPRSAGTALIATRTVGVALPVAAALLRLSRKRNDRFALLLLAAGVLWALTTLAESSGSVAYSVGRVAAWGVEPVLVVLILTFPHGRLESAHERRLAAGVAVLAATLYLPSALLAPFPQPSPWASCGTRCPTNAFLLSTQAAVDGVIRPVRELLTALLFAGVTVALARRMLRARRIVRRILVPVTALATMRAVTLAVYVVDRRTGQTSAFADAVGWLYVMSLPTLTLAFAGGLVAHRLFVADALERLTQAVYAPPTAGKLRQVLARTLRDPSIEVLYRRRGCWRDESGRQAPSPRAGAGRAVLSVAAAGEPIAAIVHDEALTREPTLLRSVSACVAMALENEQLIADLRASLDELRESRARLVSAADAERRKLERDLHDGAQQRLIALQIKVELLAEQLEAASSESADRIRMLEDEIAGTLDEVRRLGRGVYPPLLADRGLSDALNAVARTAPLPATVDAPRGRRYARDVESAVYFACMEALQNVTKHARGATAVSIAIASDSDLRFDVRDDGVGFDVGATAAGVGLTNLRDRIGALGGTVEIVSTPGRGTRVTGIVPCRDRAPA